MLDKSRPWRLDIYTLYDEFALHPLHLYQDSHESRRVFSAKTHYLRICSFIYFFIVFVRCMTTLAQLFGGAIVNSRKKPYFIFQVYSILISQCSLHKSRLNSSKFSSCSMWSAISLNIPPPHTHTHLQNFTEAKYKIEVKFGLKFWNSF